MAELEATTFTGCPAAVIRKALPDHSATVCEPQPSTVIGRQHMCTANVYKRSCENKPITRAVTCNIVP